MSEAAKSAEEIEDVLASIRRLVSGPAGKSAPLSPPDSAPKLLLTPALRVSDPDDPWLPVADTIADDADAAEDDTPWDFDDRLADWGEIAESAEEAVDDAIAEGALHGAPWMGQDRPTFRAKLTHLQSASASASADFEAEVGDANWPDPGADQALRELAQARGQAEQDAPEPDSAADDDAPGDDLPPDDLPPDDGSQADGVPGEGRDAAPAQQGDDDAPLDHVTGQATPEPPLDAAKDDTRDLLADEDDSIEDFGAATAPFSFPETEDGILDEETLREIIAEVVRQELQSELGMRITRSVRKMVRREVRLALALDELT